MLPAITDYPLPAPADLPSSKAAWRIDPGRAVLLIHDMQRYFTDAYGERSQLLREVTGNIRRLRDAAERAGVPVYFTAQPPSQSAEQRGLLNDLWGPGIQDDGREAIIDELGPVPGEQLVTKWRYDAFVRTDLHERIQAAGRDQLIVTGIYAHIGCLMTAASAFMRDIRPFLVADATADFSAEEHAFALRYAARRCARVLDTRAAIEELSAGAAA